MDTNTPTQHCRCSHRSASYFRTGPERHKRDMKRRGVPTELGSSIASLSLQKAVDDLKHDSKKLPIFPQKKWWQKSATCIVAAGCLLACTTVLVTVTETKYSPRKLRTAADIDNPPQLWNPCIMQLHSEKQLRTGTSVSAAAARLSVTLARSSAERHGYAHHLYDCNGHCSKLPSLADACYAQQCSHVLYMDTDVLLHDSRVDVIGNLARTYPDATMVMGIDYYHTMKNPAWHNGEKRMYRTDSNTGMVQFACNKKHSKRILAETERLCRRFSPVGSDQESITLMETLPQYDHEEAFVRDVLLLGQYSVVARHFPGDCCKHEEYPLSTEGNYTDMKSQLQRSGLFKWVDKYWNESRELEIPETEAWRLSEKLDDEWDWSGDQFKKCPLQPNNYVDPLLIGLDLVQVGDTKQTLDLLKEG